MFNSFQFGSGVTSLTKFAVNNVEAAVGIDFVNQQYRLADQPVTFADAFIGSSPDLTYSTTSNSTMVNSSGEIVWAPHNLHRYSSDFSSWASRANITAVSSSGNELGDIPTTLFSAVAGSAQHRIFDLTLTEDNPVTFTFYVKPGTFDYVQFHDGVSASYWADFDLSGNGSVIRHTGFDATPTITPVTSSGQTFFKITVQYTSIVTTILPIISFPDPSTVVASGTRNPTWNAAGTETLYIGGAHVYRSDLSGMNPVPGAATGFETYVPTNGAAEYLPRVGHHVYNGSAWVNEGLLIESEQRVNLITNSTPQSGDLDLSGGSFSYVTCNFTPLSGPGIHFDTTGVSSYAYFTPTYTAADYTLSVFVEMDDGNAPSFTSASATAAGNDFILVVEANVTNPLNYTVEHYGGNTYRVSVTVTSSSTTARNTGVVKYDTNSSRTFKVTGYQFEQASTPSSYIPTSGSTVTRTAQTLAVPPAAFTWPSFEYIGPELVVDNNGNYVGDFNSLTDINSWSNDGTSVISILPEDQLFIDRNGSTTQSGHRVATIALSGLTIGKTYRVGVNVVELSNNFNIVVFDNSYSILRESAASSSTGIKTLVFEATVTDPIIGLSLDTLNGTAKVTDVSVRETNPLSVSIQTDGRMTYAEEGALVEQRPYQWIESSNNFIDAAVRSDSNVGQMLFRHKEGGTVSTKSSAAGTYLPGVLVPFNIASRHGSTFVRGATDGVLTNLDTTPTALPDLSTTDLQIAQDFMGTVGQFRQWNKDIGDAGIVEASS